MATSILQSAPPAFLPGLLPALLLGRRGPHASQPETVSGRRLPPGPRETLSLLVQLGHLSSETPTALAGGKFVRLPTEINSHLSTSPKLSSSKLSLSSTREPKTCQLTFVLGPNSPSRLAAKLSQVFLFGHSATACQFASFPLWPHNSLRL